MRPSAAFREERGCVHSVLERVRIRPGSRSLGKTTAEPSFIRRLWPSTLGPWLVYETASVQRPPRASCTYWLSPPGVQSPVAGCPGGGMFSEQGLRTLPVHAPEGDTSAGTLPRSKELGVWGEGAHPHDGRVCSKQPVPFPLTSCGNIFCFCLRHCYQPVGSIGPEYRGV